MAPRKRRKVMRIDAALDAMRPMGFADSVVRKIVRDLLKAYEGNDGWPFIEDSGYRVLIETLLDGAKEEEQEQEKDQGEQEVQQNPQPVIEHDDEAGVFATDEAIGEGRNKVDHHPYEHGVIDEDVYRQDVADKENHFSLQVRMLAICFCSRNHQVEISWDAFSPADVGTLPFRKWLVNLFQDQPSIVKKDENLPPNFGGHSHFAIAHTPPQVDCPPTIRKRKPCYGWISDDDDIPLESTRLV